MSVLPHIVVVDDDVDHALLARMVLRQIVPGAEVTVMTDPHELAERLALVPAGALVLMDRRLDGRDGAAMIPALRAVRGDLRFVLLSAALSERERDRALALGAQAALEKPGSLVGWRSLLASIVLGPAAVTVGEGRAA